MFIGIVFFIPNKTHVRHIRPLTFKKKHALLVLVTILGTNNANIYIYIYIYIYICIYIKKARLF
jgi:hypothetical protein